MNKRKLTSHRAYVAAIIAVALAWAGNAYAAEDEDSAWNNGLRSSLFGDREILTDPAVISIDIPSRAEDPATVPLEIRVGSVNGEAIPIERMTVLIDKNPAPIAGKFRFGPKSGKADLSMRIRVNGYSPVRVVAETRDGRLYMAKQFVKATGGCSAPAGTDIESAMARIGKMKFRPAASKLDEPREAQLRISHPNLTGMQMDQVSLLYTPAHFVKHITVKQGGEIVLEAETDISISENPSFRFFLLPSAEGELTTEVIDSNGLNFSKSFAIAPNAD